VRARHQVELNRKRDGEMQKLQRDVEELQLQNETQLAAFRKKHQELQNEYADQIDQLHKAKQKYVEFWLRFCLITTDRDM
jgi:hypothetical protein